uniref:Uncharacterized protein n=1 Tax=viral metagenome TaxID=1070528 RepID=A0A6C0BUA4_9ZZZZ
MAEIVDIKNIENIEEIKKESNQNPIVDAMNKFYQLKSKYNDDYEKEKKEIMYGKKTKLLSFNEKKNLIKSVVPKCVNCQRRVSSIFETKVNDNFEKVLKAMCGDRKDPCPFDIEINLGITYDLRDLMNENEEETNKFKHQIILDKNDFLFGYIDSEEAVQKFDEIKDEIKGSIETSEYYLSLLNEKTDNVDKKNNLKKIQTEVYTNISNIKKYTDEYKKKHNKKFMDDIARIYYEDMIPRLKEIMEEKYAASYVDKENNMNVLVQEPISFESVEYILGDSGVIKMKFGASSSSKKEKKSRKSRKGEPKNISKKKVVIEQGESLSL